MADFQIDVGNTMTMLSLIEHQARTAREALALKLKNDSLARSTPDLVLAQAAPQMNGNGRLHFPPGGQPQASPAQIAAAKSDAMGKLFLDNLNGVIGDAAMLESQIKGTPHGDG